MIMGGNEPVFLQGFARRSLVDGDTLALLNPERIHTVMPFQLHRETVVDVACKEKCSGFYSGDYRSRQSVQLKFGDFIDCYQSTFRSEGHWLRSIDDLEFNLCQCPIAVPEPDSTCVMPVLPHVMNLFKIPSAVKEMKLSQVNLWVAIHSSRTNLHYDAYKNLLVVLHGTKSIKLYPPSQTPLLYARPIYTASTNHSEVNIEQPDLHLHPDFVGATPVEFHLNAEDALYIPEGWWHQVDTNPFTIAINYWFCGIRHMLVQDSRMYNYYARVIVEELLKSELSCTFQIMRAGATQTTDDVVTANTIASMTSQSQREIAIISLSDDTIQVVQRDLAEKHTEVWKEILEHSSIDFAGYITSYWDSQQTTAENIFDCLGDNVDLIKEQLLLKQEAHRAKVLKSISQKIFGQW